MSDRFDLGPVVDAYGLGALTLGAAHIETELNRPKALFDLFGGGRVFIGSLSAGWPSEDQLNWLMPRVNEAAAVLGAGADRVRVGRYLPTSHGAFVVRHGDMNLFVREACDGSPANALTDAGSLGRAAGALHAAGAAVLERDGIPHERRGSTRGALADWAIPRLGGAGGLDVNGRLSQVVELLEWIVGHRADDVDALPRALVHNDFQAKNVLVERARGAQPAVNVIDLEQAVVETALYDLYFLLLHDDLGNGLGNWSAFTTAMGEYQASTGPLTDEEIQLLPNVLQAKAAGVAAWALGEQESVPESHRTRVRSYFTAALEAIVFINDHKDRIRDAVREAT